MASLQRPELRRSGSQNVTRDAVGEKGGKIATSDIPIRDVRRLDDDMSSGPRARTLEAEDVRL